MVTTKFRTILVTLLVISMMALAIPIVYATVSSVTLNSPANLANTSNTTPGFSFTAVSTTNTTFSCVLYVDGANVGSNASTSNYTATIITSSALSEGARSWKVGCTDAGGEVNSSAQTLNVDATAPAVTANSPAAATNTSDSTPDFNFTYTDAQALIASCELFVDDTGHGTNTSTLNSTATVITANASIADGSHNWNVNCTDSAGNVGTSSSRTINVDTALPVVTLNSPANNANTSDSTPDFNFTATNAASVLSCTVFVAGTARGTNSSVSNATATVITANASLSDGSHNWYVNCTDDAANTGTSATRTITIDTAVPIVTINSPGNNTFTSDNTPDVNFTAANAVSTLSCELFIGDTGYGIDSSVANSTATVITANGTLSDGSHNLYVNCTDDASNTGASETRIIKVDTTAPTVTANSPANGANTSDSTPDFNFTFTDAQASNASCELFVDNTGHGTNTSTLNGTATVITANATLSDSSHNWYVNCTDSAGNIGESATRALTVDTALPVVTLNSPVNSVNTTDSTPDFNFTVTNAVAALACTLYIDSTPYGTNSSTINGTATIMTANASIADGSHNWNVNCTDDSSNTGTSATRSITIDTAAPAVTANSPVNNYNSSDSTPDFSFRYTDAALTASCELFIDDTGYGTNASTVNDTATIITANATLSDAAHSWYVNCTDSAGNVGASSSRTINVDTALPVVTLNSPANGANTSDSTPDFNFTYIDAQAASASCTLFVDSVAKGTNSATLNSTATVITSNATLTDGARSWYVNCTDYAGNVGQSTARTINIDTVLPVVALNSPANNTNTSDNTPDINFTVTNAVPVLSCTLFVDGTAKGTNSSVLNSTATVMTANASLSDGARSWYVNCTDSSSNTGQSATRTINVDTVAPAVTLNSPVNNYNSSDNTPNVNFTYTDAQAATASCTLFVNNTARGTNSSTRNSTATVITANATLSDNTYSWRVNCTDSAGNVGAASTRNITIDTVKPVITDITTERSAHSSNILWTTDETANSTVNYGTTTDLGTTLDSAAFSTSHAVMLNGLSPEVTYYYNITCCDYSSNCNTTGPESFTTTASDGGTGGSSGGSSFTLPTTGVYDANLAVSNENTITEREGFIAKFTADGTNSHTMTFSEITEDSVTITIASNPITFTLGIGQGKQITLDGINLLVTLKNIVSGQAQIVLTKIGTVSAPQQEVVVPQSPPEQTQEETAPATGAATTTEEAVQLSTSTVGLVVMFVVLMFVGYLLTKRRSKHN